MKQASLSAIFAVFLAVFFVSNSTGIQCWRLVRVVSEGDVNETSSGSVSKANNYAVQYTACAVAEPNTTGKCSCYSRRRPVGKYWICLPAEKGIYRKDTDTEQAISRRFLNRLEGVECLGTGPEDRKQDETQAKGKGE